MTRFQDTAARLRWALLAAALLCWLLGGFWLLNVAWPEWDIFGTLFSARIETGAGLHGVMGWTFKDFDNTKAPYLAVAAIYLGVFLLTQWFFLLPRGTWRLRVAGDGRPMAVSLVIAGLLAALLSMAFLATLLHLTGRWTAFAFQSEGGQPSLQSRLAPPLLTLAGLWLVWAFVFLVYLRQGDHYTRAGKILRGLFAGSVLELLVAGPAHVFVNRNQDCYCVQGSYTGLVLGGTVLLWCFGPGVALLFLRECERRERMNEESV